MSAGLAPNNQSKYGGQHALIVDRERSADSTYYDAEPSRLFMMRLYAWTKDEDDVALDAITVGIRSDLLA